ncbi:MAG: DUF1501 domain-containing protein [Bryobacterales bacterium]|nr:DUF1501 domain-containing protein [Bryobacterales bacterium]
MNTRRLFLRHSALAMAGFGTAPLWMQRAIHATSPAGRKKILVSIFQRGAADGLNIVVPFAERGYYAARPTIAVPEPGKPEGALDLNGRFGLHPALAPLKKLYDDKQLAIVTATGSPDPTRSHFDAQDYMESGTPGRKSTRDGWLNRALRAEPQASPVRAVSIGPRLPRSLRGPNAAVALNAVSEFRVQEESAGMALESMYTASRDTQLSGAGKETFEALKLLESLRKQSYSPANGARYPQGRLGPSLMQIAQLIKAGVGLEVAFADMGGWDHHTNEMAQLPNMLREFGGALAAFAQDMGDRMDDIVLVTMSEFGRTAHENGNRGTDHGHANSMFVIGGSIAGGAIHGQWPGLNRDQLYEGRDLAITTDFRDVLHQLASSHLGVANATNNFASNPGIPRSAFL